MRLWLYLIDHLVCMSKALGLVFRLQRERRGGVIIFLFFCFFTNELMARDVACLVDCLRIMFKLHAGAQASNPSSRETGGMTRIPRSSLTMYSAFEVSLGYKSICFKKKRK